MATHVALAGLSLSSMSGRLLLLVLVLALVGLLLAKRARDGGAASPADDEVPAQTHDDVPSQAEWEASVTRPSLRSRFRASRSAFVDPGQDHAVAHDEPSPPDHSQPPAPVPAPALVGATSVAAAPAAAAPQSAAPPAATPQPAAPAAPPAAAPAPSAAPRQAAPTQPGLFAPVPTGSVAAGGRAPGATILPQL